MYGFRHDIHFNRSKSFFKFRRQSHFWVVIYFKVFSKLGTCNPCLSVMIVSYVQFPFVRDPYATNITSVLAHLGPLGEFLILFAGNVSVGPLEEILHVKLYLRFFHKNFSGFIRWVLHSDLFKVTVHSSTYVAVFPSQSRLSFSMIYAMSSIEVLWKFLIAYWEAAFLPCSYSADMTGRFLDIYISHKVLDIP
jgi:hypothetical protein